MAENSKIEWCNHTANLWWGCTKVHAGCDHCYAETLSNRWDFHVWGNDAPRRPIQSVWNDLNKFQKKAKEANEIHRVFVGSMMDIFEKPMPVIGGKAAMINVEGKWYEPTTEDIRIMLFDAISNNKYPNLIFLFLTKRPSNINKYIPEAWKINPPSNVMYGTSPCNQETFDTLWPQLAQVNGMTFLSIEPQLGRVDIKDYRGRYPDWLICGGESGHDRRPFDTDWGRVLKNQCEFLGIPFFMKQIDKVIPIPDDLMIRQFPKL